MSSRFLWKLYGSYVLLLVLATTVASVVVARRLEADALRDVESRLVDQAQLLARIAKPAFDDPASVDLDRLQADVEALGASVESRLTLIDPAGYVLADSEHSPALMTNHKVRPEIQAARQKGLGVGVRLSLTRHLEYLYVAMRVPDDGEIRGFVRAAKRVDWIDARLAAVRTTVLSVGGLALLGALVLGFVFARRFAGRLTSLVGVAETVAEGEYERRLPVEGDDEIDKLGEAFNRLASSAGERMASSDRERGKLLAILGSMVEGVLATDREGRILHMNRAAARILRVDAVHALGRAAWEVVRVPEIGEVLAETLRDRDQRSREVRLVRSPRDRFVELLASPLSDPGGEPAGAVVVMHDVSDLRRLEAIRRDFVANVSHELKTPITAIRGIVETILDDPEMPDETQHRFIERIESQSDRLAVLVTDLLTLSRLESEAGVEDFVSIDLRTVVRSSITERGPGAEDKLIKVSVELPSEPVFVRGDSDSLRLVLDNLFDNAVKYTREGGSITIELGSDEGEARVAVSDTGVGIEAKDLDRIFQRFYRVDKARSRELGGTGLGLSIVKHVCLTHGGDVSVESVVGRGSTFRVRIPLA